MGRHDHCFQIKLLSKEKLIRDLKKINMRRLRSIFIRLKARQWGHIEICPIGATQKTGKKDRQDAWIIFGKIPYPEKGRGQQR